LEAEKSISKTTDDYARDTYGTTLTSPTTPQHNIRTSEHQAGFLTSS